MPHIGTVHVSTLEFKNQEISWNGETMTNGQHYFDVFFAVNNGNCEVARKTHKDTDNFLSR
jgi:hypothetical protein